MRNVVLLAQCAAILLLFAETVYLFFRRPSKMQVLLLVLQVSTIIMLIGYLVEIQAETMDLALAGVAFAYLGKPFALLSSLMLISEYCGRPLKTNLIIGIIFYNALFPIFIFTNGMHHLYYSSAVFDSTRIFSPLILGHGPLYFLYMATVIINFIWSLVLVIREFTVSKTKQDRQQVLLLFGMIFSSVAGYVIFLTGITKGYDTTMAGAFIGAVFLSILFFRYRLYDALTLAKDQALNDATNGLIVFSSRGKIVYSNDCLDNLLKDTFTIDDMYSFNGGVNIVHKNDRVYQIKKEKIENNGRIFGITVEISDITMEFNYSAQLERDVENRTREIFRIQRSIISSFAGIVEARDNTTGAHIKHMSKYVELISEELINEGKYSGSLNSEYVTSLIDVAPLHDIGKLCIPDSILLKPARLSKDEFDVIKTHTTEGSRIIRECLKGVERDEYVSLAVNVAEYHHERWDGTGYPHGLSGADIPLAARIVSVADVYEAVRAQRPYKPPMDTAEARQIIVDGRGTFFDPDIVDAFLVVLPEIEKI